MKIVITGSLGHIGRPLATELVRQGHAVTVISHHPEREKDIRALGATAATGSVEDVDFLAATFAGADAVFAMVPPNFAELDQVAYYRRVGDCYVGAIQRAGVPHVAYLSSYGAHLDRGTGFILGAYHVENLLNALPDVAVTHLRAGYFYYNLYNFVDMIKGGGLIGANFGGDDRLALVAPADIAEAAAEELARPATGRKVRYVVSDERTANEVARALGAAIGHPDLKWITFADEQMRDGLEKKGVPAPIAANFVEVGAGLHSGVLLEDYALHPPVALGKVKLADFAREFAAAF